MKRYIIATIVSMASTAFGQQWPAQLCGSLETEVGEYMEIPGTEYYYRTMADRTVNGVLNTGVAKTIRETGDDGRLQVIYGDRQDEDDYRLLVDSCPSTPAPSVVCATVRKSYFDVVGECLTHGNCDLFLDYFVDSPAGVVHEKTRRFGDIRNRWDAFVTSFVNEARVMFPGATETLRSCSTTEYGGCFDNGVFRNDIPSDAEATFTCQVGPYLANGNDKPTWHNLNIKHLFVSYDGSRLLGYRRTGDYLIEYDVLPDNQCPVLPSG